MGNGMEITQRSTVHTLAKAGLISKGIVYIILGALAFMAAFEIGGQSSSDTNRSGVLSSLRSMPAGKVLLLIVTAGLLCYCVWRIVQAFHVHEDDSRKKWGKRARYIFSCLAYLSLAFTALQVVLYNKENNGDTNQHWAAKIMSQPFGQWLLGIGALILAGVGIYQIWYGLSEKYKKHVESNRQHAGVTSQLLVAGKIGYVARGIVWLLLAYMGFKAAVDSNPKEAGDTGKAFQFLESWSAGSLLLGALALGLIAYGIFNFIRARFETFR